METFEHSVQGRDEATLKVLLASPSFRENQTVQDFR